jgi:hypothetical protein
MAKVKELYGEMFHADCRKILATPELSDDFKEAFSEVIKAFHRGSQGCPSYDVIALLGHFYPCKPTPEESA